MYPRMKNNLEDYDKNRLKRRVLRCSVKQNIVYYFDDDGIFQKTSLKEAYDLGLDGAMLRTDGEYAAYELYATELPTGEQYFSRAKKVIATLKEFLQLWKETPPNYREKPSGVRRFITKIERPEIERFPENFDEETFDYITIDAYVASTSDRLKMLQFTFELKEKPHIV